MYEVRPKTGSVNGGEERREEEKEKKNGSSDIRKKMSEWLMKKSVRVAQTSNQRRGFIHPLYKRQLRYPDPLLVKSNDVCSDIDTATVSPSHLWVDYRRWKECGVWNTESMFPGINVKSVWLPTIVHYSEHTPKDSSVALEYVKVSFRSLKDMGDSAGQLQSGYSCIETP